jgi:glucokinase
VATQDLVGGIDLGGTKILSIVCGRDLEITGRDYRLTEGDGGPEAVLERMVASLDAAAAGRQLAGVGISAPGVCDVRKGIVTVAPNLTGWKDVPLAKLMTDRTGIPAWIENDGSCGALAEHRAGAGRGFDNVVLVTLGTGVGGGLVLNGRLFHGASGAGAEIGHMKLIDNGPPCGCGRFGCLEPLASGRGLGIIAQQIAREEPGGLVALMTGPGEEPDAEALGKAADAGDPRARQAIREAGRHLGDGFANLIDIFNPDRIVVAGSLRKLGPLYLDAAIAQAKRDAFELSARDVEIVEAALEDDAAAIGAAIVAFDHLDADAAG